MYTDAGTQKPYKMVVEICLEINAEKTKYLLMPQHQIAGQHHKIKTANKSYKNVANFKYLVICVLHK
jgi:hypothetical protein